jgi:hypothetical protein
MYMHWKEIQMQWKLKIKEGVLMSLHTMIHQK